MEKRKLGRTGLDISLLTFGCGAVGGLMTKGDPADQTRAVQRALELGINFFDTAPLYGDGASETNVGRIFSELKPNVVLGTKVNVPPEGKQNIAAAIDRSIEKSLRRLRRDHVDLLQLHNSISPEGRPRDLHPDVVLGEVVPAFDRLKKAGKIRFAGITAIGDTASLHRVVEARAFDTAQIVYNLLNPSGGRALPAGYPAQDYRQLVVKAAEAGMGTIIIRVLAGGALSGEEARHPLGVQQVAPIGSGADYRSDVMQALQFDPAVAAAGVADKVELAIRFVASHPAVTTLQVGIATPDQFEGAAAAVAKGRLPEAALARIRAIQDGFAGGAR
jgi:L-galactose dehydrogenase/L-glyceraldehyde 3-phosphate reductase